MKYIIVIGVVIGLIVLAACAAAGGATAPVTTTIAVWGDGRPNTTIGTAVSSGWAHVAPAVSALGADVNIGLGDYVYLADADDAATIDAKYAAFLAPYHPAGRTLFTLGNHEAVSAVARQRYTADILQGQMGLPADAADYYEYDVTPGIHVLVCSSAEPGWDAHLGFYGIGDAANSEQADWLVSRLQALRSSDPTGWILVALHHPVTDPKPGDPYDGSAEQAATKALFAGYKVALVLNGDVHTYRRHVDPSGVTYLTQATAGAPPYDESRVPLDSSDVAHVSGYYGYTTLSITGDTLSGHSYEADPADWDFTDWEDRFTIVNPAGAPTASPTPTPTATSTPTPTPTATFTPAPADLSRGRPVEVTSSRGGRLGPGAITDEDPATRWVARRSVYPQRATIDLGAVHKLSRITVRFYAGADRRAYGYRLLVSAGGTDYLTVADRSKNTTPGAAMKRTTRSARYVRVVVTRCTRNDPASIVGVRVTGW